MDNLIFCLNATVPIFAIILLGRLLRGRHFFAPQTLADLDKLAFKVLLPILLFRDIAAGRITEQFDLKFFLFCAGITTVYFFAIWLGAAKLLPDKSMVGALHRARSVARRRFWVWRLCRTCTGTRGWCR